ncbi:MAG: hypothetical protein E7061_08015 [Treponema sp.]|nr:hypothetical protein [Treponema sp.]
MTIKGEWMKYRKSACLAAACGIFMVLASCSDGGGSTSVSKPDFIVAAQAFELDGETSVDNFKLHWNEYEGASYYRLYRSTSSGGSWTEVIEKATRQKIPGTMYDVYDAGTTTYYYKVQAYSSKNKLLAETAPVKCVPFTDTTSGDVFDNTVQSLVNKPADEIFTQGKYWRYIYNRVNNAVWYVEQWSLTGYPDDSEWTTSDNGYDGIVISGNPEHFEDGTENPRYCEYLATSYNDGNGCKLESTSYQVRPDGVIVNWSHYENGINYSLGQVICIYGTPGSGILTAAEAPYHPKSKESRDLVSFVDTDGSAYIIGSTSSAQTAYKLDETWTKLDENASPITLYTGSREAPCFRVVDGWYYLFSSEQAGWYPTQGAYMSSNKLSGLAEDSLHSIGNRTTFGAQSGQIDKIGSNYYMLANRWSQGWRYPDPAIPTDSYLGTSGIAFAQRMLPVLFKDGYAFYDYYPEIKYDYEQGLVIPVQKGKLLSIGCSTIRSTEANASYPASNAVDGISYASNASSPSWGAYNGYALSSNGAYSFVVQLDNPAYIKEVDVTFRNYNGSESASQYTIDGSIGGTSWTTLKDKSSNYIIGFNENIIDEEVAGAAKYRYIRINVTAINDVNHNSSGAWWTAGIHEVSVYGSEE